MLFKKDMKNFIIILILSGFLINITKETCECTTPCSKETCETGTNCKFFYEDNSCLECPIYSEEKPYYTKDSNNNECISISGNQGNEKVIYVEGQNYLEVIKGSCPNLYSSLGDFCYLQISDFNIVEGPANTYKCINFFYKELINGFIYYKCLQGSDSCSEGRRNYIYGTKECMNKVPSNYKYYVEDENEIKIWYLNSCPQEKNFIKKEKEEESDLVFYRCSNECKTDDPENIEYKYIEENESGNKIYCLDNCPNASKFFYNTINEDDDSQIKNYQCLSSCKVRDFSKDNICYDSSEDCNGLILVDISRNVFSCQEGIESCPYLYPYSYQKNEESKKYCLKSCKDTQNKYFSEEADPEFGVLTYLKETITNGEGVQTVTKECLSSIENTDENEKYYKDEISLKWVTDCKSSSSGPYHNETHCKTECENYFKNDDLECIDQCQNPLYLDKTTNACYENCPAYLGKGFYNENNECQTCDYPENEAENSEGKGFYIQGEKLCYASFPFTDSEVNEYYHNYGENICFTGGCSKNLNYIYQKSGSNICYKSCKDIEDGSYKIEIENICYKQMTDISSDIDLSNYYHYVNSLQIDKYVKKENAFDECSQLGLYYIRDSECVSGCENDYKIIPTKKEFGYCYNENNFDSRLTGYDFYNKTKILKNKCDLLTIKEVNSDQELVIKIVDEENCVNECPTEYYEYVDEKECRPDCKPDYYILEESNKKNVYLRQNVININIKQKQKINV